MNQVHGEFLTYYIHDRCDWHQELIDELGLGNSLKTVVIPLLRDLRPNGEPRLRVPRLNSEPPVEYRYISGGDDRGLLLPTWTDVSLKSHWKSEREVGDPPVAATVGQIDGISPGLLAAFDVSLGEVVYTLLPDLNAEPDDPNFEAGPYGMFEGAEIAEEGMRWGFPVVAPFVPSSIKFIKGSEIIIGFYLGLQSWSIATAIYNYGIQSVMYQEANDFYPSLQRCWESYVDWLEAMA